MELVIGANDEFLAASPISIKSGLYDALHLDLSLIGYIRPHLLVRLRTIIDLAVNCGLRVRISPPVRTDYRDYAGRMGLFEGTDYNYPYNRNEPHTFFPLLKINNDRNQQVYEDCMRVLGLSNVTSNYLRLVVDAFVELADNIYFHSGTAENTGWGYIHAQANPLAGDIRLGLSDVGIGIYGSYERTGQLRGRNEVQVMSDIFNELESSLNLIPGRGYRGVGLYEVQNFLTQHTGHLKVMSGNVTVDVNQMGIYTVTNAFRTEGTWIQMRVPIR